MNAPNVSLALAGVAARPLRSLLMALTLAAGAGAAALCAAILGGYAEEVERMAFGAYARSLVITENVAANDRFGPPRLSDLTALEAEFAGRLAASAVWRESVAEARAPDSAREFVLFGVRGDFRVEADMPIAEGRAFTPEELAGPARVCMLGDEAARQLMRYATVRTGRQIHVNGVACTVIGVFGAPRSQTAERYARGVFAPFLASVRYFEDSSWLAPNEASRLTLVLLDRSLVLEGREDAERVMRREHGAPLSQRAPFRFIDEAAGVRAVARQRDLLARLLLSIAAVSMTAAIVGYGATTLVAVESRRRDIAIQMASGATAGDIRTQFVLESLLLGFAGAVLGAVLAAGAGAAIAAVWSIPVRLDADLALAALAAGVGAGLVAGALPSDRAAAAPPALAVKG